MKNIKNLVLTAMIAISTLSDTVTCAVPCPFSLQTATTLCFSAALPITALITFHGVLGSPVIANMIEAYKQSGPLLSGAQFFSMPPTLFSSAQFFRMPPTLSDPHIPTTIIGILGMATTCAAMGYFDNQIKAQQQLINLNTDKKRKRTC